MAKKSSATSAVANQFANQPRATTTAPRDLEGLREFWQTTAPFDPVRELDSWEARFEQGKAVREQTPREAHATWTPPADRTDPVATVAGRQCGA